MLCFYCAAHAARASHSIYIYSWRQICNCALTYTCKALFLLVLKLTVWIMFFYYKKFSLADKVFTWSLAVCISTAGSSQLKELQSLEEKTTPLPSREPNCWCFVSYDQITCLSILFDSADFVKNEEKQIACVGFGKFLASPLLLCLFAAWHFTPWPISNQGCREGIEDNNRP